MDARIIAIAAVLALAVAARVASYLENRRIREWVANDAYA